ncbi:MAG: DUF3971 domain-containing protein [bacterium]|nr:DUF3971 domain-containing protein [Candidatus Sumerlaeota bacterium]
MKHALLWCGLALVIFLAAAGLYIYHVPIRWQAFNDRVAARLEAASGARVAFDNARFFAARGLYTADNVRFGDSDPRSSATLIIQRVDVLVSPLSFLFGHGRYIKSLTIWSPSELEYQRTDGAIIPGPRAALLARILSSIKPVGAGGKGIMPFRVVRLMDACVRVSRETTATRPWDLPARPAEDEIRLADFDIEATGDETAHYHVTFNGVLQTVRRSAPVAGAAVFNPVTGGNIDLNFPRAQFDDLVGLPPGSMFRVGNFHMSAHFSRSADQTIKASGELLCDEYSFMDTNREFAVDDNNAALSFDITINPPEQRVTVDNAHAITPCLEAQAGGVVSWKEPHDFDAQLSVTLLGEPYRPLVTCHLPPGFKLDTRDRSFTLTAAASGNMERVSMLIGKLAFTSVTLNAPYFDRPVEDISGTINFEPARIVLHDISAIYGQALLNADGEIQGDYLNRHEGLLTLNWKADATADDMVTLFDLTKSARAAGAHGTEGAAGSIVCEGNLTQYFSLGDPVKNSKPKINGWMDIKNVGVKLAQLPMPLTNLNGHLKIEGNRIIITGLSGNMEGSSVDLQGQVAGKTFFWRQPELTVTGSTNIDLANAVKLLPEQQRAQIAEMRLEGRASADFSLSTSLRRLDQAQYSGGIQLHGVGFSVSNPFFSGDVRSLNARLKWDGGTLRAEQFSARLNGDPVSGMAVINDDSMGFNLQSQTNLRHVLNTFPRLQRTLDMDGPARLDTRLSIAGGIDDPAQTNNGALDRILASIWPRFKKAFFTGNYSLEGKIDLGNAAAGAMLRHKVMPMAKTNDGEMLIPRAELRNIHGTLILSGRKAVIPTDKPALCDCADSKNCGISGSFEFRPGNLPRIEFSMSAPSSSEARMDSWLFGWGEELRRYPPAPAQPPHFTVENPSFDLLGRITAGRTSYKGQIAGSMKAVIEYTFEPERSRRTIIRDIAISGFGGNLRADSRFESRIDPEKAVPVAWSVDARIHQMQLLPLLTWVFRDVRNIDGIISTQLRLEGAGTDPDALRGVGASTTLSNLEISRTPFITKLGERIRLDFQGRRFKLASAANFDIGGGAVSAQSLRLESKGLVMNLRGNYYFNKTIDAVLRLDIFETVLGGLPGQIPLLGQLASDVVKLADRMAERLLLAFRISGNAGDPDITPIAVPLFQDLNLIRLQGRRQ